MSAEAVSSEGVSESDSTPMTDSSSSCGFVKIGEAEIQEALENTKGDVVNDGEYSQCV